METVEVTLQRVIKIWWLVAWRTALFVIIVSFFVGLLLGFVMLFMNMDQATVERVSQISGVLVGVPLGIWVFSQVFEKSFSDFRVVLVRRENTGNEETRPAS